MIDFHAAHGVVLPLGTPRAEALAKALKPSFLGRLVGDSAPNLNLSSGGATPLCFAAAHGLIEDVRVMIKHGAHPGKLDKKKRSPLYWAAHAVRYDRNAALACVRELAALSPQPVVDAVATGIIDSFEIGEANRAGSILGELQRFVSADVNSRIRRLHSKAYAALHQTPERAAFNANHDPEDGSVINTVPVALFERAQREFGHLYDRKAAAPIERLSAVADGAADRLVIETLSEDEIDTKQLKKLLQSGANPNAKDAHGRTAMELAVMRGDEARNAVRMLSEHGASVRSLSTEGDDLLATAWRARAPKIAGILLRRGIDANATNQDDRTILQTVVAEPALNAEDAAAKVRFAATLLEHGANAQAISKQPMRSPVLLSIEAAEKSKSEPIAVLDMLLAKGGLFDERRQEIHVVTSAVDTGREDVLRSLLAHGANVNLMDRGFNGGTALHDLADRSPVEPGQIGKLVDAGAELESRNAQGETPLIVAARRGNQNAVDELLARGAILDAQSRDGRTALVEAVGRGNDDVARLLLNHCSTISAEEKETLVQAVKTGGVAACDFLKESGAPLPILEWDGNALLDNAAQNGQTSSVVALLNLATTRNGDAWHAGHSRDALRGAMAGGHYETAAFLIDASVDPRDYNEHDGEQSALTIAAQARKPDGLRFLLQKMPSEGEGAPDLADLMATSAEANAGECVATLIEHGASLRPATSDRWQKDHPLTIAVASGAREAAEAMLPHCDNNLIAEVLTHCFEKYRVSDSECDPTEKAALRAADGAISRLPHGDDRDRIERMAMRSMERSGLRAPAAQRECMPFVAAAEEQRSLAAIVKTAFSAKATSAEQDPGATVAPTLPALGSVGSLEAAVVASATAPPTPAPKHKGMRL